MKERRQFERYEIALPARIETTVSKRRQLFNLKTRDISASGAFIDTDEKFSEGVRFKMDFTVSSNKIKALTGSLSLIECEGCIVRTSPKGMAVCFDKECQILSLKGL